MGRSDSSFGRLALRRICCLTLTIFLAAFLGAALVRFAPGFGMDERQLDTRLSDDSIRALQATAAGEANLFRYFISYFAGLCRGDLGYSTSLGMPVKELLGERVGITLKSAAGGIVWAWILAAAAVIAAGLTRGRSLDLAAGALGGGLLCVPAAVIALLALYAGAGPALAIGAILLPRLMRYLRNATGAIARSPHVLTARARGVGGIRLQARHVWLPAAPEILALGGISVNMALGAAIPVEALCDSPGVGQLIWKAALARDLPVLVNLTILVAAVTATANLLTDAARAWMTREA